MQGIYKTLKFFSILYNGCHYHLGWGDYCLKKYKKTIKIKRTKHLVGGLSNFGLYYYFYI